MSKVLQDLAIKFGVNSLDKEAFIGHNILLMIDKPVPYINALDETGIYVTNSSTAGIPEDSIYGGVVLNIKRSINTWIQIHVDINDGRIRSRSYAVGATSWSPWQ